MQWFCLQTHAKKEFLAQTHVKQQGFETFLPVYVHSYPKLGDRILPLFPGYLFVQFDPEQDIWYPLMHTIGVKKLFAYSPPMSKKPVYDYIRPIPVPGALVTGLQQQIIPSKAAVPTIAAGARVKVTGGHFQDQQGICTWSNQKRVALLLDAMTGQIECTFARDLIEPMDPK